MLICAEVSVDIAPPDPRDSQERKLEFETVAVTRDPDKPIPPPFPVDLQPEKSEESIFIFDPTVS
jgi:hypothetical protein